MMEEAEEENGKRGRNLSLLTQVRKNALASHIFAQKMKCLSTLLVADAHETKNNNYLACPCAPNSHLLDLLHANSAKMTVEMFHYLCS